MGRLVNKNVSVKGIMAAGLFAGAVVLCDVPAAAMERDPFAEPIAVSDSVNAADDLRAVGLGEVRVGGRQFRFSQSGSGELVVEEVGEAQLSESPDAVLKGLLADAEATFDLDFDAVETRKVLMVLAALVDVNLVIAGEIQGVVSLHLEAVRFAEVLDLILFGHALDVHREGNIMLVAPEQAMARYREERLQNDRDVESLAPLVTRLIEAEHAEASEIRDILNGGTGQPRALSERGSALVDARTNTLVLIDSADRLAVLEAIVAAIDVPVRQVLIEARVINVDRAQSAQTGVLWRFLRTAEDASIPPGSPFELAKGAFADVQVSFVQDRTALDVQLSAMASEGLVEIVAQPKVITADQRRATVESGVEIPFQQATSSGATSTAFKEAVLQLEVTPRITPGDRVSLDLEIKQDTIGAVFAGVPSVNTTKIITRVLVEDRQTVVLGGIAQTDRTTSVVKTPLLGDLPIVRHLFRQRIERDDEQDLLVFITPTILDSREP